MGKRIVVFGDYYIEENKITPFMGRWLQKRRAKTLVDFTARVKVPVRQHIRITKRKIVPVRYHRRRVKKIFKFRRRLTPIEIENLKKIADRQNVSRDLIDWKSEIDSSLNYHENKRMLEEKIRMLSPTPEIRAMTLEEIEGEFKKYINDLEFRAGAGDIEAKKILEELR